MQLKLDETVVTRFEKVDTRLIASTTRARTDRRNPLWRQKHLRSEGINYYENASLFRAGGKTTGRGSALLVSWRWERASDPESAALFV